MTNIMCSIIRLVVLIFIVLNITACNILERLVLLNEDFQTNRDYGDYQKSSVTTKRLDIPDSLNDRSIAIANDLLTIPDVSKAISEASKNQKNIDISSPNSFFHQIKNDDKDHKINIQSQDNISVIRIPRSLPETRSKLISFWSENNIKIIQDSAAQNVMELPWLKFNKPKAPVFNISIYKYLTLEPKEELYHKLRIKLVSVTERITEIHLQSIGMPVSKIGPDLILNWQKNSTAINHEWLIIPSMMSFLSQSLQTDKNFSLLTEQYNNSSENIALMGLDANDYPLLKLIMRFDDAWSKVGLALKKGQFDVGSKDKVSGRYFITYITKHKKQFYDIEKKDGFSNWLKNEKKINVDFFKRNKSSKNIKYSARETSEKDDINNPEGFKIWAGDKIIYRFKSNKLTSNADGYHVGRYQIVLSSSLENVYVSVKDEQSSSANKLVAKEILSIIKNYL